MKGLHCISFILLVIGGLNWGLEALGTGLGHWFGGPVLTIIYALVGIAAIFELVTHKKSCKNCSAKAAKTPEMPMQGEGM